jgi:hypothetical protein
MDNRDYHFYDLEEKQTEGRSLLDNGLTDHTSGPSNYLVALAAGILGVLLLLTSFVLAWILFSRWTGSSINLSHAIMCTLALLFGAFATFFAFSLFKDSSSSLSRNANIAFIVYIGSLLFAVYFIVAALYLWVQQQFFSNVVKCQNTNAELWKSNFWGIKNYDAAQLSFWRIYLVLAIFAVLIAVCFAILAWAAWTVLTNKVQSKKITLGIALIAIVVFGFLVVIWFQDHKATYFAVQSKLPAKFAYVPFIVFVFGIIALALAFLNAVGNFIPAKTLNFIFAILWVGFFLVFAIFVALLFRTAYTQSKQRAFSAQETSNFIAQRHYREYCPSKYLANNQYCGGAYATLAWESGPVKTAQLNPVCDCSTTDLMFWPWFCLAIFCAFLLASVAVAAVSNFGLASSENDEDIYRAFHIFNVIAIALILILALALGLWLIFRPSGVNNLYQLPNSGMQTSFRGELGPNKSFASVPDQTSQNIDLKDQCYFLGKVTLPELETFKEANGGYSVGVLVTNGKINSDYIGSKARVGPKVSRQHFFPNALNSNDDYINIYGNSAAVTEGLRNLVVCQSTLQLYHGVYLSALKTDVSKISENSLTGGVSPVYTEPYPTGSFADLARFTSPVGVCVDSCNYELVKPVKGYLNIRGTLLIKNAQGQIVNYGVPEAGVELSLHQNEAGKQVYIAVGSYDANGNFLVQAPYIQNAAYKAVLHITDKTKQYQSNLVDILVNPPNTNSDLNVGSILLTTNTGVGCKQTVLELTNQCFANQSGQTANANLQVNLHDIINVGEDLQYPLTLTVRRGFSELSPLVHTELLNGPNWSKVLPVGYYSASVSGNGYSDNVQRVTLDSDKSADFYLERKSQGGYRIYAAVDNTIDPDNDYDLNLKIRSADGKECVVSPANRVCPFASHIQSISNNEKGFEVIELSKFTNAYYMVFLTKNPRLSTNCPFSSTAAKRFLGKRDNHLIDWTANPAVRIFTTLSSSIFGSSQSGLLGTNSYSEASKQMLNPIKYGEQTIIPNLFSAINTSGNSYPASSLFSQYVDNTDSASVFGAALPLLYPQNDISAQVSSVKNSNLPSSFINNFSSWANYNNPDKSQDFVVASVFGQISGVNDNKNEVIREENGLQSGFNYYNTFDNTSYNTIGGFMTNFPGWDSGVQGQFVPGWSGASLVHAPQPVVEQPVTIISHPVSVVEHPVVVQPVVVQPVVEEPEIEEEPTPVVVHTTPVVEQPTPVVVQPVPVVVHTTPVVEQPTPVVVHTTPVVVQPVVEEPEIEEEPTPVVVHTTPVVEQPTPVVVQPVPVVVHTTPVVEQPTPVVVHTAPVEETTVVSEPVAPVPSTTNTVQTESVTPFGTPPEPAPPGTPEPNVVVVENSSVDYTGSIKAEPAYKYTVNLRPDGTYPLETDLIPETTVHTVTQTTTTQTVASPTNVINVQSVEQVTPVPIPVVSYPTTVVTHPVEPVPVDLENVEQETQPNQTVAEETVQVNTGDSVLTPVTVVTDHNTQHVPVVNQDASVTHIETPVDQIDVVNVPAQAVTPIVVNTQTEELVQPVVTEVQEQVIQPVEQTVPAIAELTNEEIQVVPQTDYDNEYQVAPVVTNTVEQQIVNPVVETPVNIEPAVIPTHVAPIVTDVQTVTETPQQVLTNVYDNTPHVQTVLETPQVVQTVTEVPQQVLTNVVETPQEVIQTVDNYTPDVQTVVEAPQEVVQTVVDNTPVVQTVTEVPQQVVQTVVDNTPVVQTVTEVPQQVVQTVTEVPQQVVQTFTEAPQQVVQTVTEAPQQLVQTVTEVPQQVVQTVYDNTPHVQTVLETPQVVQTVTEVPQQVVQTFTEAPQKVVQTVTEAPQQLIQTVTEVPQQVVQTVYDNTPHVQTVLETPQVVQTVTEVPQQVVQTFTEAPQKVVQTVTEAPQQVVQTVYDNTPHVQTVLETPQVVQTVTEVPQQVVQTVTEAPQQVFTNVVDTAQAFPNTVNPQITDVVQQYTTQPITQAVTDTSSSITNAITGATDTVTNTVADTASAAVNQVIPDRRLRKGRLLQAAPNTYYTQFCFTGFGERSIKPFSSTGTGVPSIQPCQDLYPDSDSYSLKNLKPALD